MGKEIKDSEIEKYSPDQEINYEKAHKRRINQVRPKPETGTVKSGSTTYTPIPQQERIRKKYADGMSIRKIARDEHKARETVTKIVRSEDMEKLEHAYAIQLQEQLDRLAREVVPRLVHELKYSKDGGKLAFELAERLGGIPPKQRLCPKCRRMW